MYVHDWLVTGLPPVQPGGDALVTVRVCVPFDSHAPHAEYMKDVHDVGSSGPASGGGGGGPSDGVASARLVPPSWLHAHIALSGSPPFPEPVQLEAHCAGSPLSRPSHFASTNVSMLPAWLFGSPEQPVTVHDATLPFKMIAPAETSLVHRRMFFSSRGLRHRP
jgi:hypothetical protein